MSRYAYLMTEMKVSCVEFKPQYQGTCLDCHNIWSPDLIPGHKILMKTHFNEFILISIDYRTVASIVDSDNIN